MTFAAASAGRPVKLAPETCAPNSKLEHAEGADAASAAAAAGEVDMQMRARPGGYGHDGAVMDAVVLLMRVRVALRREGKGRGGSFVRLQRLVGVTRVKSTLRTPRRRRKRQMRQLQR